MTNINRRRTLVVNGTMRKGSRINNNITDSIPTLLWWDSVYNTVDDIRTCDGLKCHVTNNKDLKQNPGTKVCKKCILIISRIKRYVKKALRKHAHAIYSNI